MSFFIFISETNNLRLKQALGNLNNDFLWKTFMKTNKKASKKTVKKKKRKISFEKTLIKNILKTFDKNNPIHKDSEIIQIKKKYGIGKK